MVLRSFEVGGRGGALQEFSKKRSLYRGLATLALAQDKGEGRRKRRKKEGRKFVKTTLKDFQPSQKPKLFVST